MKCPNCGEPTVGVLDTLCGCSYAEQAEAARIREREARRSGRKKVLVDHLKRQSGK